MQILFHAHSDFMLVLYSEWEKELGMRRQKQECKCDDVQETKKTQKVKN